MRMTVFFFSTSSPVMMNEEVSLVGRKPRYDRSFPSAELGFLAIKVLVLHKEDTQYLWTNVWN